MKYLFIVQGEGRGHLTQAISLSQMLRKHGHEVAEVLVGKSGSREIPQFFTDKIGARVRTFDSPALYLGKAGKKVQLARSILLNITPKKLHKYRKSARLIHRRIEKHNPDVVVNFYEIMAGLTNMIHRERVPFVNIAHQFLVEHPDYGHHLKSEQSELLLRINNMLCSIGATKTLALSFYPLPDFYRDRMAVLPPLLRDEVLALEPQNRGYILGYMLNSGFFDEVHQWHKKNPETELHLFWDKKGVADVWEVEKSLTMHRINDTEFLRYMEGCSGYITTAGFESICEAMYLGKPAMMIPVHIEQQINAADAAQAGAGIIGESFDVSKLKEYLEDYSADRQKFRSWVDSGEELFVRHLTTLV